MTSFEAQQDRIRNAEIELAAAISDYNGFSYQIIYLYGNSIAGSHAHTAPFLGDEQERTLFGGPFTLSRCMSLPEALREMASLYEAPDPRKEAFRRIMVNQHAAGVARVDIMTSLPAKYVDLIEDLPL